MKQPNDAYPPVTPRPRYLGTYRKTRGFGSRLPLLRARPEQAAAVKPGQTNVLTALYHAHMCVNKRLYRQRPRSKTSQSTYPTQTPPTSPSPSPSPKSSFDYFSTPTPPSHLRAEPAVPWSRSGDEHPTSWY
ncbi:hypothetical protein PMIN06_012499 [Paraphaeosphaeria minitans]|uniref:Uncharacterized protein n=1 Tax=Paraphaeosphaeria minitans TaxID=565426 RepID=A0A9P6GAQ2_9PLEO|nr:hypothetical protein PMIN01_10175 [Paraphaeosphaeria minitans]